MERGPEQPEGDNQRPEQQAQQGELEQSKQVGSERSENSAETTHRYRPRVYAADLSSEQHDIPGGQWIDADQDADDLSAEIAAALHRSPVTDAEAWAVQATDGFAGLDLYGLSDTALISQLAQGVTDHGAAYAVYVAMTGTEDRDLLDRFEDFYVGTYDSPEAWAREVGEDLEWDTHLDRVVDPQLRPYLKIDYAQFARDARAGWDVMRGIDGKTHIFMR